MTDKVKNALVYVGLAGAIISLIAYMLITIVIIRGFQTDLEFKQHLLFAGMGALFGILFNFNVGIQGITLAKREIKSQEVLTRYQLLISDNKTSEKPHTIVFYMIKATIFDIIINR